MVARKETFIFYIYFLIVGLVMVLNKQAQSAEMGVHQRRGHYFKEPGASYLHLSMEKADNELD